MLKVRPLLSIIRQDSVLIMELPGSRRRISHLWLFLLLTPVVSFAFAQTLFYIALLLTEPGKDAEMAVRQINIGKGLSMTVLTLSGAYLSAFVLPYAYGTRAFLWVFLIAYATPLILTYLPHRRGAKEANWRLISIMSVVLYSYQLSIVSFSHTVGRGQWSDLISTLYDLQWAWIAHPVTRALGYDLLLSAITLVYWSYVQNRATLSGVIAADTAKRSAHGRTNCMSNGENLPAHSRCRSPAIVALTVIVAGIGAGSASVYQA